MGALLAAGRAAATMVYLSFAYRDQLNPITRPASYYVYVDGGRGPFETSSILLALGVFGLLIGMAGAGVRMAGRPTVLFGVWACCMLLAAIFPTDDSPDIETLAGLIHQFAGAGILALLSFAGLAAAPRLAESPAWRPVVGIVRLLSIGAALLATAYVMTRLVQLDPETRGHAMYSLHDPVHGLKAGAHHAGAAVDPEGPAEPDAALVERIAEWVARTYPDADPEPVAAETCMYTTTADEHFILERRGKVVIGSPCSGHGFKFAPAIGTRLAALAADIL